MVYASEGMRGDIFRVNCDGKEIPYEGMMAKRGDPDRIVTYILFPGDRYQKCLIFQVSITFRYLTSAR